MKNEEKIIDLSGPKGNAYYLLGVANKICPYIGKNEKETKAIITEMTSGDYKHLLEVFEKYFGDYIVFKDDC